MAFTREAHYTQKGLQVKSIDKFCHLVLFFGSINWIL